MLSKVLYWYVQPFFDSKILVVRTNVVRVDSVKQGTAVRGNKRMEHVLELVGAFRFFFKHDKRRTRPQEECFVRSVGLDAHDLG